MNVFSYRQRKFSVGDRVVIVNPGARGGDCRSSWIGATGVIDCVESNTYEGELIYHVKFDESLNSIYEYLKGICEFWVTEDEIDFSLKKSVKIDDLL